jgi:hypothetical protein
MALAGLTVIALLAAFWAGRATLRSRAIFMLGKRGPALAPAVLASLWLVGVLAGQVAGSVTGMAVGGAVVLLGVSFGARRFARRRRRTPLWTPLDWTMFAFVAVVFSAVDLWDVNVRSALISQFLHGNIPPRALNDPRFPLAYHGLYDALCAMVMRTWPMDVQSAMAIVSVACVALTLSNLQALSRTLFARPAVAQLARALFMFGFGPVFIRCIAAGGDLGEMHGHTAQSYVDLILRRPAGLGFAFFTLALAMIVPCYGGELDGRRRRAVSRLLWLTPVMFVLPQLSEEAMLFLFVYLAALVLARRVPPRTVAVLLIAAVAGALQSGVVLGVLGHRSMATPTMHVAWPPRLPTWAFEQTGVSLRSYAAAGFWLLELGPVFLIALALALVGRDSARRAMGVAFLAGTAVALFASTGAWKKSDLDRFFFYGTPPVFLLAADLPDRVLRAMRSRQSAPSVALAAVGLLVCGPTAIYPGWQAAIRLREGFRAHAIGGDLRRNLDPVGPREPILTTLERANDVIMAGFLVIAPIETNEVTRVTAAGFDDYVRANAGRAVWLFLPESDPRVAGRPVVARDSGYVLVHATKGGNPR